MNCDNLIEMKKMAKDYVKTNVTATWCDKSVILYVNLSPNENKTSLKDGEYYNKQQQQNFQIS